MELSSSQKLRVFVSYDAEHDTDLLDLLLGQAGESTAGFEIMGRSEARSANDLWDESLHRMIRESDLLIAICGEHCADSGRMGAELRIAQEEQRPYLLLWGRRDPMCTKPSTALPSDSMYSWTPLILADQIRMLQRTAATTARTAAKLAERAAAPTAQPAG
jgi:hypothetical protein